MKMILSGMNLVMTIIGFAVSMMFIVFVCTRLICARIQLRASRNSFPLASGSDLSVMERGLHGLEARLIASFPTTKFGDHVFAIGRDTLCTICLSEYQVKDVLRVLPYCGHAFHVTCIDIWLKQHSTCPVCRISLLEPADTKLIVQPTPSVATRSPHLPETFPLDSDHSSHADHGYSDRMIDNQSMGSTQSDQQISEPSGARGMSSTEVPSSAKNVRHQESEEKNTVNPPDLTF